MYRASVAARRAAMCLKPVPGQRGGMGEAGGKMEGKRVESMVAGFVKGLGE